MPASLDLHRLVHVSQELLLMAWHGVQPKRLGMLALDLLLARESAARMVRLGGTSAGGERARHALAFIARLEEQVLRLYATHRPGPRGFLGHSARYGPWRR